MSDVNLSISKELVQPIIEAKINAAVCEALSGQQSIVSSVVEKVLSMKVDSEGKYSSYNSSIPFIQWLCQDAIKQAAIAAVKDYLSNSKEMLVVEVRKAIVKNQKNIAVGMVDAVMKASTDSYRMKIDVNIDQKERY